MKYLEDDDGSSTCIKHTSVNQTIFEIYEDSKETLLITFACNTGLTSTGVRGFTIAVIF